MKLRTALGTVLILALTGCDGGLTCEQWREAINALPSGSTKDAFLKKFNEKYPEGCPVEPTTPPPPTTTTTTTTTLPAPVVVAPLIPDEELSALVPDPVSKKTWPAIDAAIRRWRAANPALWTPNGACLVNGPVGIDNAFQGVSNELLVAGIVAGQSIQKSGKRSDCIFVNEVGTDIYAEAHIFDYSRGCVSTVENSIKGNYRRTVSPGPVVTPTPEVPSGLCTVPVPLTSGVGGLGRIGAKRHTGRKFYKREQEAHGLDSCGISNNGDVYRLVDSTPNIYAGKSYEVPPTQNYCAKIGSFVPGTTAGNTWCPARLEGTDPAVRKACEDVALGGKMTWKTQPSTGCVLVNPDNSYQAACVGCNTLAACNVAGTICSEWVEAQ